MSCRRFGTKRWGSKVESVRCVDCDTCIKTCEYLASPKIRFMSVEELVAEIKKRKSFFTRDYSKWWRMYESISILAGII